MKQIEIEDMRGLPVWERAAAVMDRASQMPIGQTFEFKMELDPRPLLVHLDELLPLALDARYWRVGEREWRVAVRRVPYQTRSTLLSAMLRKSAVFAELTENAKAVLTEAAIERVARKGEALRSENIECAELGLLLEGVLMVTTGANAREQVLFHVYPGEVFGAQEFFDEGRAIARTVVVSKNARYAAFPYDGLRDIAMREPSLLLALGAHNAQRCRQMVSTITAQVSQPTLARVAAALLPYAAPSRGLEPALAPLPHMTQAQLAAAAGTVKEVAARAIAELERMNALRRERGHVRYLDRSKLLETIGLG